jgi:hypothetical protein
MTRLNGVRGRIGGGAWLNVNGAPEVKALCTQIVGKFGFARICTRTERASCPNFKPVSAFGEG